VNDPERPVTRLTPLEKIGYGLGDFASNVVFQSILILLPVFYTDTFGLDPAVMGMLFLVVRGGHLQTPGSPSENGPVFRNGGAG